MRLAAVNVNDIRENWALVAAVILIAIVAVAVSTHLYRRSARGQLRARISEVAAKRRDLEKATRSTQRAKQRLQNMAQKSDKTRPSSLQEAKDATADAGSLQKIAHDQVLIAENHLRRVIHEEYAPRKHQAMRERYLPSDRTDKKPFSF